MGVRGVRGPCCDIITTYDPKEKNIDNKKQNKKNMFKKNFTIIWLY
jgi:hypothetical protein